MSALDQSLDDILSSKPKKQFRKRTPVAKAKVGKTVGKPKVNLRKQLQTKGAAPKGSVLDASYANKVVVYHLPKDIKQDAIKVCFEYCCVWDVYFVFLQRESDDLIITIIVEIYYEMIFMNEASTCCYCRFHNTERLFLL